jgi:hypothetical protein
MRIKQWIGQQVDLIPGLAQEARPQSEWPYKADWIVSHIKLDTGNRIYWIEGRLKSGESFFWGHYLDRPLDWRYDLAAATYETGRHETDSEAFERERKEYQVRKVS